MDYVEIGRVSEKFHGIPIKLVLNRRVPDRLTAHHVISWRTLYPSGKANRRFYWLKREGCWTIPCSLAVRLMEKAERARLLDTQYDDPYIRFGEGKPTFHIATATDSPQLFRETTRTVGEPNWGSNPLLVMGVEPSKTWRKVMIVDTNCSIVTFRSLTTDTSYRPIIHLENGSGWHLDNAMLDCSTEIMRYFLNELKKVC